MRHRSLSSLPLLALLLGACADHPQDPLAPQEELSHSLQASHSPVPGEVPPRGETGWSRMSAEELWEHVATFDTTLVVGLKRPDAARGIWRGHLLIGSAEREAARDAVLSIAGVELIGESDLLPLVEVRAESPEAVAALRALPVADYVEPGIMDIQLSGTKGCEYPAWTGGGGTTPPGDLLPLHYTRNDAQIDRAWNRSRGGDVVVGITDTGVSYYQNHLHHWFATGESTGRWSYHTSVLPGDGSHPAWHDQCGHGTRTTGAAVAPMNGDNMVGVAWRSDLITVRFTDDVVMPRTEETAQAIAIAASYTPHDQTVHPRRVVGMAWGHWSDFSTVADEIERRYEQNKVLFVGASGTSGWFGTWTGVVFPARMNEVIAVSAVNSDYSSHGSVHYGPEVELAFIIDQATTGFVSPDIALIAGSSGATAIVTGIAALTWSQYPTANRDWIRQRLQWAGHATNSGSEIYGHGVVNAMKAVGGMYRMTLQVQMTEFSECRYAAYRTTAVPSGGDGPFGYNWDHGPTSATVTDTVYASDPGLYRRAHVTDTFDGTVHSAFTRLFGPAWCGEDPI